MTFEDMPLTGKVSIAACLGFRVLRPACSCCGGSMGIRRAWRHADNSKPKHKLIKRRNRHNYRIIQEY
jgi:hypothetical protein